MKIKLEVETIVAKWSRSKDHFELRISPKKGDLLLIKNNQHTNYGMLTINDMLKDADAFFVFEKGEFMPNGIAHKGVTHRIKNPV